MKRLILCGVLALSCCLEAETVRAASFSPASDCRHLLVQDVRLSDRIAARQRKDAGAPGATGYKGFAVHFDALPGIGVMHGATLTPEGRLESTAEADETLETLQKNLLAVRDVERVKSCPVIAAPADTQQRLEIDEPPASR